MLKEEKGMTLVSLVLIIVVLLIIAGVGVKVVVQNSDVLVNKPNSSENNSSVNAQTTFEDARDKVKLVFELCEANYQIDLSKGDATDRSQVFTAETILGMLENYNIEGNTLRSLGEMNLSKGVTVNYGNEYTFIVRVSNGGMVTVIEK